MVIPSPYAPGAQPEYLAGRGSELEEIRTTLSRMKNLGRSGGPLMAFYGPRGLGKTSLLRQARREAIDAGFLTAWVTGRDDELVAPRLAASLSGSVKASGFGERAEALLHSLDKVQVEFGVPGAGKVVLERGGVERLEQTLHDVLENAGHFATNHGRHGLVVFVDEFPELKHEDRRSILIALQDFDEGPRACPVSVIAAGLPSVFTAAPAAATFGERTAFIPVGGLTDVAVAEALVVPALDRDVKWGPAAVEEAVKLSGGYPHQVQLLGDGTWRAARPEAGTVIGVGDVRQGFEHVQQRMEGLFHSRWARATPEQRRLITAMASLGDEPVERSAVAATLGVAPNALSRPRQELLDRGIVTAAGYGKLQFTVPGFARFVRRQEDTYGSHDVWRGGLQPPGHTPPL